MSKTSFIYNLIGKIPVGLIPGKYRAEFVKLEVKYNRQGKAESILTVKVKEKQND